MKICYISVTCPDIKPSYGSTPTFSGTGTPLVPLFLCFKVKVTPWVNAIGHVSHQKIKICHISVPCNHIITIYGSTPRFSGMGNPLVPLVLWLKWAELKQTQQKWAIFSYFELIWPFCDLAMTFAWPLGDTPVKPNPNPCHHVYLGWDSS